MTLNEVIIIGAGAAAAGAAMALSGLRVLVLDQGHLPPEKKVPDLGPRLDALKAGCSEISDTLIGANFEAMALIGGRTTISPKLKSPFMRYITRDWETLSPAVLSGFEAQMSFAYGGFANGWGAGAYRFTQCDLKGFPLQSSDLEPFYDALTPELGVNGEADDLADFFGSTKGLVSPLALNRGPGRLYDSYRRHRDRFHRRGFHIGRPRLAVLSESQSDRSAYGYNNMEFFNSRDNSIYTPSITFDRLRKAERITYQGGVLVERYHETADGVDVFGRSQDGATLRYTCKKLIIAAGCLNSAKIVLVSNNAIDRRLPLLDNQVSYVPLVNLGLIGAPHETRCFGMGQLNVVYTGDKATEPVQGTIYDVSGPLRSDLLFDFPFHFGGAVEAAKLLTPALCLVQFFYPDDPLSSNYLAVNNDGKLLLSYATRPLGVLERETLKAFIPTGWLGLPQLCKYPKAGNSYHYAGSLPMKQSPGPFETSVDGLLFGTERVHIADSAVFTRLPSKNLTFTSMANAMRIGSAVKSTFG